MGKKLEISYFKTPGNLVVSLDHLLATAYRAVFKKEADRRWRVGKLEFALKSTSRRGLKSRSR